MADFERLVKLAYPNTETGLQDTLAKDQFVDVLPDDKNPFVHPARQA